MNSVTYNNDVKKIDYPFAQLFFLLTKYEARNNALFLAYSPENLQIMRQCVDSSVASLLKGLQLVGDLLADADSERLRKLSVNDIGEFISTSCNLIDVLSGFGSDASGQLQ